MLVFPGRRGRKMVQKVNNYGGSKILRIRAPYYFQYRRVLWAIQYEKGTKNAKKDPKNDAKRLQKMLSPSLAARKSHRHFLNLFTPGKICTKENIFLFTALI